MEKGFKKKIFSNINAKCSYKWDSNSRTILWTVCSLLSPSTIRFSLRSYTAILVFMIVPSSSSPADWPCILLCEIMGKAHIFQAEIDSYKLLFFRKMFIFTSVTLGMFICTQMFMLLFQQLFTKDLELAS